MYTLIEQSNSRFADIVYETPCGDVVQAATVHFGDDLRSTLISFTTPVVQGTCLLAVADLVAMKFK